MPNEASTYENLQLDPVELVDEVQEEVKQQAAADSNSDPSPPTADEGTKPSSTTRSKENYT